MRWRFCTSEAPPKLVVRDVKVEPPLSRIDEDRVAVVDRGDRTADRSLGCDVPDHVTVRRAGEAAVGDERDLLSQPRADDRAGHAEHLAHAGPTLRALVADDHAVAFLDLPLDDRGERVLLA